MRALSELQRYVMHGEDADVGRIEDVYFDDHYWVVRHLVVDTRHWLRNRRVLIPPAVVQTIDDAHRKLVVSLTRSEVERSPTIDTAKPVSRQHHVSLYSYFGFPYDWTGPAVRWDPLSGWWRGDPHLRSAQAVTGYDVEGPDGRIGQAEDFVLDLESWAIRFVVVRAGHWRDAHRVLISPDTIARVSWEGRVLTVVLPETALRHAPGHPAMPTVDRNANHSRG